MPLRRPTNKMETSVNRRHEENDCASDGWSPRKRQRKLEAPSRQVQLKTSISGMHRAKNKLSTIEQAAPPQRAGHFMLGVARDTMPPNVAESSKHGTADSTSTEPKIHKTNMRYINNEPVDKSVTVVQTVRAKDQDMAMGGKQRGQSNTSNLFSDKSETEVALNKEIQHQSYATERTAPIVQKRAGRFLSNTAYPGVLEPDIILIFKSMIRNLPPAFPICYNSGS